MSFESNVIDLIHREMPSSPLRKSISGEVDSETILLGDREYLFTTDDFSEEDLLQENDPYVLGWNIACGAISDIIASGGKPLTYAHSLVIPKHWDKSYISRFSKGIAGVLQKYSLSFIGGDLGRSEHWRYTATVIGEPWGKIVNRRGCQPGDAIFMTGEIGAGNLEAVLHLFKEQESLKPLLKRRKNRFSTHDKLPAIISKYASSAIDTSDGVFSAIQTIADLNKTGFLINNLHFLSMGNQASKLLNLPALLLFLGECGEYEILFTVSEKNKENLKTELLENDIKAYELGFITANRKKRNVIYHDKNYNFAEYEIKARDYYHVRDYLQSMMAWVMNNGDKL